jgi:diguanylate cyclase (GGDEF)-like protein/PAS domain S-box-containing protein
MVIPLAVSGEVVGSLSVNFTREKAFDGEIRRHLGGVATRMSVALECARNLSRLRLQGIALTSAPNAIIIADRQGRIEWANESFCRLSGQALEGPIGRSAPFLCEGEPGRWRCSAIRQPESAIETWRGELVQCHADGRSSIVEQIITTLRGPAGEITHFVTVQEDITARKESERRIEYLAHHDALTGLANRVVFQESLARALEQARRGGRMLALLLLDLDRFKLVNDSLGHAAGDLLLQSVAGRVRAHVRGADLVARLGGDEFAIVQADPEGTEGAATLARRILEALDRPIVLDGREIHTTASIGITVFPGDEADGEQFDSERMNAEVQARLTLENALRGALARQELALHYQPQAELGSSSVRITSVEALLRWQHPERGLISPGEFIPVAEDSGLIVALGRWALRRACADCRAWRESGLPPLRVDVNISAVQFHRDDIVATATEALVETGLDADCLGLEVTESLLATDIRATAEALHRLRRLGVRLSIDDFGTGYSSLSYLGNFPFDRLKIDKAFVEGGTSDPNDLAIIRAIISLGHTLRMRVLAEGVETPEQRRCLAEMQCDEIQGRLISRPLPTERLVEFLRDRGAHATPCGRSGSMSGDWRRSISHRATPRLYSFE